MLLKIIINFGHGRLGKFRRYVLKICLRNNLRLWRRSIACMTPGERSILLRIASAMINWRSISFSNKLLGRNLLLVSLDTGTL